MKHVFGFLFALCSFVQAYAQDASVWIDKPETEMRFADARKLFPLRYRTAGLNVNAMRSLLFSAPSEQTTAPSLSTHIIEIPAPNGKMDSFRLVDYMMMEPGLANRYPDIRTYRGVHIHDPFKTIRCDWTVRGFSAIISSFEGRYHVEPFARQNLEDYIIFYKRDYPKPTQPFSCGVENEEPERVENQQLRLSGDCTFRSYRLAVAVTGEYSNHFMAFDSDDEDIVLSEVVIAVNRVNEVYERDVTVRLILIANTTAVFYYNAATDPFSGDACTQLTQNQGNMTSVIGSANYDIGHVFSTGSGGCAGLGVVCSNSNKARGATGISPPTGDLFYIDYVAHEIGHQFNAGHTQNNPCNSVSASRMEPGSGSTVMGYAGICDPNVQSNSDDYFHGISVQQINNYISGSTGNNCDAPIAWSNSAPVLTASADYTIPISTPFALTAIATDPNSDPITYCWEQWNTDVGSMPPSPTNEFGPMFRSFDPSSSPTRYFPRLQDLVNNTLPTWEVLPSVTRDMEFRVTIRDFHSGMAGCTDEDNVDVNTTSTSGPFLVTSPNTSTIDWTEQTTQTVTWNVANTTNAPVSCANVDIFLSYDGGFTYPATLITNTPNDGNQLITVPPGTTAMARVMVKGRNNIFFDISNENFDILTGMPTYALIATPPSQTNCPPATSNYSITVQSLNGYASPVTLSEVGHPSGSIVSFSVNPVVPGNSSQMSITVPGAATPADYTLTVNGASAVGPKSTTTHLVIPTTPLIPLLVSPVDGATEVSTNTLLDWQASSGAEFYSVQLSTDALFNSIVFQNTTTQTIISPGTLDIETTYYWRVRSGNVCVMSAWSNIRDFVTAHCGIEYSTDVPKAISGSGTPTISSSLLWTLSGGITDINVIDLEGTHTWLGDLRFSLTSPSGTTVVLIDQWCTSQDNFNINLDDQATPGNPPCPYNNGNTYQPEQALSAFIGEDASGIWVLTVTDLFNLDGGSLNSWALEICVDGGCPMIVTSNANSGIGSLRDVLACAAPGDTITFAPALFGSTINLLSPLIIATDVYIVSTPAQNINLNASLATNAIQIIASTKVSISGITIVGGSALTGGGIQNLGTLVLKNITINPGPFSNQPLVANQGSLSLEGNCQISQ